MTRPNPMQCAASLRKLGLSSTQKCSNRLHSVVVTTSSPHSDFIRLLRRTVKLLSDSAIHQTWIVVCLIVVGIHLPVQASDANVSAPRAAPGNAADVAAERTFHCDGTDPALFQEMQESGWVGYGETWDLHTCDEGAEAYVAGMNRRWRAWRGTKAREKRKKEMSFYAALFPFVAFGGLGSMFGVAFLLAAFQRRRRVPRQYLYCRECAVSIPVAADDPGLRNAFCPACGKACELLDEEPAISGSGALAE